jgi:hypothetical protein
MCLAAFAAAMTDTTLTLPGVLWVLLCAVSTAGYLLLMKTLQNDPQNKMGDATMLIVNNCCALPLMLVSWALSGEIQLLPQYAPPVPRCIIVTLYEIRTDSRPKVLDVSHSHRQSSLPPQLLHFPLHAKKQRHHHEHHWHGEGFSHQWFWSLHLWRCAVQRVQFE